MTVRTLGIDFGTSNTVGVFSGDSMLAPLLFDGSPLLPSGVCLEPGVGLLAGRDAHRAANIAPACLEPNPKRRIDEGTLWLGEQEIAVAEAIAAVLRRVVEEAGRVAGHPITRAVLTYPAGWAHTRSSVLTDAAQRAGLALVDLVAEPVAAARYFVGVLDQRVPVGQCVVVYDFGAGTFDAAVVTRTGAGFDVLACDGLPDVGGLDLDAAIVAHLRAVVHGNDGLWGRIDWPANIVDQRARRSLWQEASAAKEQLSRQVNAPMHIPLLEVDTHLTREELERLARPLLDRTVTATMATLRTAGIARESIAGVFLVGGSSRIPLAARLLHKALGIVPTVIEQPELVVAAGAVQPVPAVPPVSPRRTHAATAPVQLAVPGLFRPPQTQTSPAVDLPPPSPHPDRPAAPQTASHAPTGTIAAVVVGLVLVAVGAVISLPLVATVGLLIALVGAGLLIRRLVRART